jgi:cytochrome c5
MACSGSDHYKLAVRHLEGFMRLTAAFIGLAILAAPSALAGPAEGAAIYEQRCKMCHATGMANAPLVEKLATYENQKVLDALNTPVPMMAGAVSGMSDEDKRNVAVFLTKKSLPASGALPEVKAE